MEKKHSLYWNKPVSFSINLGLAIIPAMSRGFCSSRTDPGQGAGRGSRPPSWYPGTCNWLVDFWSFSVGFPSKQPGINWADQAFDHFDPRKKVLSGGTTSPLVELTWPGELLEMYMIIHDMFFLSMAHCCKSQVVVFPESIRNPPSAGLMFEHGKTPRFPRFPGKIAQPNQASDCSMRFLFVTIGIFNLIMAAPRWSRFWISGERRACFGKPCTSGFIGR